MRNDNGGSRKLWELVKVVDEVVFQANILALQASVAAPGEENGFARAADEVRDLARRGAQTAREAGALLPHSTFSRRPSPVGEGERIS